MKFYQLTYLISPNLTKEDLKKIETGIITFLQEQGGILDKINSPVEKKLGYLIKKQNVAFLTILNFYLEQGKILQLEEKLKSEPEILRYLILLKNKTKVRSSRKEFHQLADKKPKKKQKEKVELKEIEKKLEEIFKES